MRLRPMRLLNCLLNCLLLNCLLQVLAEGDRVGVGVRYVLSVGGDFADRACNAIDRSEFIRSEIAKRGKDLRFNVEVTRHAVAGCGRRRAAAARRAATWDKDALDSKIEVSVVLSDAMSAGEISVGSAGVFNMDASAFHDTLRRMLGAGDEDVRAVARSIGNETYSPMATMWITTSAAFASDTSTSPDAAATSTATDTSASPAATSTASGITAVNSSNRVYNQFSADDLSKEFPSKSSSAAVIIINVSLILCCVMVALL